MESSPCQHTSADTRTATWCWCPGLRGVPSLLPPQPSSLSGISKTYLAWGHCPHLLKAHSMRIRTSSSALPHSQGSIPSLSALLPFSQPYLPPSQLRLSSSPFWASIPSTWNQWCTPPITTCLEHSHPSNSSGTLPQGPFQILNMNQTPNNIIP